MSLVFRKLAEMALKNGKLVLEMGLKQREWDSYGEFPGQRRLRYIAPDRELLLPSLNDLRLQGFDLAPEFGNKPTDWATFLSMFLALPGPVIQSLALARTYGIAAEDFGTRFESDGLRWFGIKPPDSNGPAMFYNVKCMSETLQVVVEKKSLEKS